MNMISSRVVLLVSSAFRAHQQQSNFWQRLRKITCSAVFGVEDHFIEREFEKAREDLDIDALGNPNSLLEKLERDQNRRIKATKRARTARLFKTQNEPRSLTWDTMEQIRYLKQEHGDEWSVRRLAHSFDVTEAVVVKVLKSKFAPADKRRSRQDAIAKTNAGLLPEETVNTASKEVAQPLLSPLSETKLMTSVEKGQPHGAGLDRVLLNSKREERQEMRMPDRWARKRTGNGEPSVRLTKPGTPAVKEHRHAAVREHFRKAVPQPDGSDQPPSKSSSKASSREGQEVAQLAREPGHFSRGTSEPGDGGLREAEEEPLNFDMENLESYDSGSPPPQLLRRGNEFFDEKGEFLFRV